MNTHQPLHSSAASRNLRQSSSLLLAFFSLVGSALALEPASIDAYFVGKELDFLQTSSATPTSGLIASSPEGGFLFVAGLAGSNLDQLSPLPKLTLPNASQRNLTGNSVAVALAATYPNKSTLDAAFPNGTYRFTAGTYSLPVSLGGTNDAYPAEIPQIINGTWNAQGQLVVNAATGATLNFNTFSSYYSGTGGEITFSLYSISNNDLDSELVTVGSATITGYASDPALTSYAIPAGYLLPDHTYFAGLAYTRLADLNTSTLPAVGMALFLKTTGFYISTGAQTSAPVITTHPASQTSNIGGSVTFTAAASGTPTPGIQWQKNGTDISGAIGNSYTIANIAAGDAANYRIVATNSAGTAISNSATLTVNVAMAPVFTTQPASRTEGAGASVTLSGAASGTPAPSYQWQKNGTAISGATSNTYTMASVTSSDAGTYTLIATNSGGSVTSDAAILTVGTIPAGFDVPSYLSRYPDLASLYSSNPYAAWLHYRDQGIYQGEVFDELFRVEEYLVLYPDLAAIFGNDLRGALEHWLNTGRIEGRLGRIPLEFKAVGYFERNPDVAAAVNQNPLLAWSHYWLYGIYEGRAYDEELNVFEYLAINADLTAAFVDDWRSAALHWMRYGRTEGRLGRIPLIFSSTEYLARYPEVGASWGTYPTTVWLHFWLYGIEEGRTFDEQFRVDEYLALNPDLAAVFGTDRRGAFMHWVRYGQAEGRRGRNS